MVWRNTGKARRCAQGLEVAPRCVHPSGMTSPDWTSAIARAERHAPYLAQGLERLPDLAALLAAGKGDEALTWAKSAGAGFDEAGVALRREKRALALALGIGDLAGAFPLARVMAELSQFADRALGRAIAAAITERVPGAEPAGFLALALGKHGAGELNYSSDIDPIRSCSTIPNCCHAGSATNRARRRSGWRAR